MAHKAAMEPPKGKVMHKITRSVLAAGAASLFVITGAQTASASDTDLSDTEATYTIYLDQPAPDAEGGEVLLNDSAEGNRIEASVVEDDAFPVVPAPGESVRIVYTDAVTFISTDPLPDSGNRTSANAPNAAAAASCTQSQTSGIPYLSNARVRGRGSAMISSGCRSGSVLYVFLNGQGIHAENTINVSNNGSTFGTDALTGRCAFGNNTTWSTITRIGAGGGAVWSQGAQIGCSF